MTNPWSRRQPSRRSQHESATPDGPSISARNARGKREHGREAHVLGPVVVSDLVGLNCWSIAMVDPDEGIGVGRPRTHGRRMPKGEARASEHQGAESREGSVQRMVRWDKNRCTALHAPNLDSCLPAKDSGAFVHEWKVLRLVDVKHKLLHLRQAQRRRAHPIRGKECCP